MFGKMPVDITADNWSGAVADSKLRRLSIRPASLNQENQQDNEMANK
jgi:hypothetical protein